MPTQPAPPSQAVAPGGSIFTRTSSLFAGRNKGDREALPSPPAVLVTQEKSKSRPPPTSSSSGGGSGDLSPPPRRNGSRHSISSSVTDFGASIRRSASLRSASARSPSSTTLAYPNSGAGTPPDASTPPPPPTSSQAAAKPGTLSLSNFARRKKSVESVKSLKLQSLPPEGSYPAFDPSKSPMAMGMTAVQLRQIPPRPNGTSHSHIGFGESKTTMAGSAPVVPALPTGPGSQNPHVTFNHIQDLAAKRINTLDYLRKSHEGRIYWFNTLLFTNPDLRKLPSFSPPKLARRATNYLLLGFSLPQILDLNTQTPAEYLRALNALLAEFETYQTLHPPDGTTSTSLGRGKIPQMFRRATQATSKNRRASSATEIGFPPPASTQDFPEPASAVSAMPPFGFPAGSAAPSASTTTIPPADAAFMSSAWSADPSFSHSNETYSLLVTPSLPFDPDFFETFATLCEVLIDVYRGIIDLVSAPEKVALSPGLGDLFAKADARVRKILVAGIVREFEDVTRAGVKAEVGGVGRVVLAGLM